VINVYHTLCSLGRTAVMK